MNWGIRPGSGGSARTGTPLGALARRSFYEGGSFYQGGSFYECASSHMTGGEQLEAAIHACKPDAAAAAEASKAEQQARSDLKSQG